MFKKKELSPLANLFLTSDERDALKLTYNCSLYEIEIAIPSGYEITGAHFNTKYGPYWKTANSSTSARCDTLGIISRGFLYLSADRMIQQLYEDRELAPGYCCIMLSPKQPERKLYRGYDIETVSAEELLYRKQFNKAFNAGWKSIAWQDIYQGVLPEDIAKAATRNGVTLVEFRFVEVGEKYLQHDLKSVQTWTAKRAENQLRFMRWVVK